MRIRDVIPAAILAAACLLVLAAASLRPLPGQDQVGVVFPPSLDDAQVLARVAEAGARLVRPGAWPFIAVVAVDGPHTLARLEDLGALFTVNPLVLGACLARPTATPSQRT